MINTKVKSILGMIDCLLWSNLDTDNDGRVLSFDSYSYKDLSNEAVERLNEIWNDFCEQIIINDLEWIFGQYDIDQIQHDLMMTLNRTGCGFWDGDYGEIGDILTDLAHQYREIHPYIADDELIYLWEG